ncbi:MAG TPA: ROK family transcriptional regulator [Candidatus Marinimicrobia bacterium]|nr:ROK family transcriptional regulator [Candidatus Neomarinimicrobiota bacterium]
MNPERTFFNKGDSQFLREVNEVRLLNLIRTESPISRSGIAKLANMSKATVSEIIHRLDELGLIIEIGKGESTAKGGKRPTLLKMNPEGGYVFGLEFKLGGTLIALANIEGQQIAENWVEHAVGSAIDEVLPNVISAMDDMLAEVDNSLEKLVSIGLGTPGLVNYDKGMLLVADTLGGWANQPLTKHFTDHFGVPVVLENDVNTITLGEFLFGIGQQESDMICISIGDGIGAGIIQNRKLIRGINGAAGEIGYIETTCHIGENGVLKYLVGNHRYFGELLSEWNLFHGIKKALGSENLQMVKRINRDEMLHYLKLGDQGNSTIQKVLDEYAVGLGVLCSLCMKTINPSLIILNGLIVENSKYLISQLNGYINRSLAKVPLKINSRVAVGSLGKEAGIKGAIALASQILFRPHVNENFKFNGFEEID